MKIIVFGGTTEGRQLAEELSRCGHEVTVCVASQMGAEELDRGIVRDIRVGRLDEAGMCGTVAGSDLCIDATHPYAVEVSASLRKACAAEQVRLRRVRRPQSTAEGCTMAAGFDEAARLLSEKKGNALIATGAREIAVFAQAGVERLYPRILPTHESLAACEEIGIPHRNIIAMHGPFSQELNEAVMRQYLISWLVTKDGGVAGGFREKIAAAAACGAGVILIGRPPDEGEELETLLAELTGCAGRRYTIQQTHPAQAGAEAEDE